MAVYFVFIDGIGLGEATSDNPFTELAGLDHLNRLWGGQPLSTDAKSVAKNDHLFKAIDANMDVEGLPQSGTGQTALFTGHNVSKDIGKHFGPFPHSACKPWLKDHSLFSWAKEHSYDFYFVNAYPEVFFKRAQKRNRWSCSTLMVRAAGHELNRLKDVQKERALTAEIKQDYWRTKLNADLPEITAEEAGMRYCRIGRNHDMTLYEFYLTDKAGHAQEMSQAEDVLQRLNGFFKGLLDQFDASSDTLVVSSDHGNLEDLSTKSHTRNPVPLVVIGKGVWVFDQITSITGVKASIQEVVKG